VCSIEAGVLTKTQTNVLVDSSVEVTTASSIVRTVLTDWSGGNIAEAAGQFDNQFTFTDHRLGLGFNDKNRLIEFMTKTREFFPDAARTDKAIFTGEDRVISEWATVFGMCAMAPKNVGGF
jgi:hypothetical protein